MGYLEKLLAEDEKVILKAHRHMLFVVLHMIPYALLTIVLFIAAWFAADRVDGSGRTILLIITIGGALLSVGVAVQKFLVWKREEYVITSLRILQIEGLVSKRVLDSSLEKVNDVQLRQSIFARIFGYGDLAIMTGSDHGVNDLWGIADPFEFKRVLLKAKLAVETRHAAGQFAAAPAGDGMEAARLMAALTDLRDSGVITSEEYEHRRRQLLSQ